MKLAEKWAAEKTGGGNDGEGKTLRGSHSPWKSRRASHIPTAPATARVVQYKVKKGAFLSHPFRLPSGSFFNWKRLSALRKTRSFSLDPEVLSEVERTKGSVSASERVNHLLKYALEMESKAGHFEEAARFFAAAPDHREERRAFQRAAVRSWVRK